MRYFLLLLIILSGGCSQPKSGSNSENGGGGRSFTVPEVPVMLTTPTAQAEFLATHFWDNFNFKDTAFIGERQITERAFADFVNILSQSAPAVARQGIDTLMQRAWADSLMYAHFMKMSEDCLYDPNSLLRNEDLYIMVLQAVMNNTNLDEICKERPRFQLNMALKNRVGMKADNFTYTTDKGGKAQLYSAEGNPLLLFFYHPDCHTCMETKDYLESRGIDKLVRILYVNSDINPHLDAQYDLRASPTLYLLDKNKIVLMKDVDIRGVEEYIMALPKN